MKVAVTVGTARQFQHGRGKKTSFFSEGSICEHPPVVGDIVIVPATATQDKASGTVIRRMMDYDDNTIRVYVEVAA